MERHPKKFTVENWSNLLDQVWGGGGGRERERKCLLFCNIFGEELGEHVFHQNFASFMKSESWKKKKKGEKKQLLIRPLNICLLFFKKYFTSESAKKFWIFLQILNLKIWFSTYKKHCMYIEMAQIRQNFYLSITGSSRSKIYIQGCLNLLSFISSL